MIRILLSLLFFAGSYAAAQPAITAVSADTGTPGTNLIISGTGFAPSLTGNVVYFGPTKGSVMSASPTSLTVKIPTGGTYGPISVTDTANRLTGFSLARFTSTFRSNRLLDSSIFASPVIFSTGAAPKDCTPGDFNNDGKVDVVVVNTNDNNISIFRNIGTGGAVAFMLDTTYAMINGTYCVAAGDFDGDGRLDLAIGATNGSNPNVSVVRNISTGSAIRFSQKVDLASGQGPYRLAAADLDGDGRPDIVVTHEATSNIGVFRNTSVRDAVSFAARLDFSVGSNPAGVAIGDVDGDGLPDIVTANLSSNSVSFLRNNRTSIATVSFAAHVPYTLANAPWGVALGDIDRDGKLDAVITTNGPTPTVTILRNTSTAGSSSGAFSSGGALFATGLQTNGVRLGDLDGDGWVDIVACNYGTKTLSIFKNQSGAGNIKLAPRINLATDVKDTYPEEALIVDLTGDGRPDILAINFNQNSFSVFRNDIPLTSVEGEPRTVPSDIQLNQNYPNPFNPTTVISYQLPAVSYVSLKVFDVLGQEVATLVNEEKPAGVYSATWNAVNMPSGVYFSQLRAAGNRLTRKMLMAK